MHLAALRLLKQKNKIIINDENIVNGLKNAQLQGRLTELTGNIKSWVNKSSEILIDGCHNPSAAKVISNEMIKNLSHVFPLFGYDASQIIIKINI